MDQTTQRLIMGAAGAADDKTYVDDVFSTFLYEGSGSTRTITNGIDLAGNGGFVWTRCRNDQQWHEIDYLDGNNGYRVYSNTSQQGMLYYLDQPDQFSSGVDQYNSDGYRTKGGGSQSNSSYNSRIYASWTFRKAPGFCDVVAYTGNGSARTIAHSLESIPGMILVKKISGNEDWTVYHRESGNTKWHYLNTTDAAQSGGTAAPWNNTTPTASVFSVGSHDLVNENGQTYVAYLFAHDVQSFGKSEDQSIIKCGSYTGNGSSTRPLINLGWEPQFILLVNSTSGNNWYIWDTMRGIANHSNSAYIFPNSDAAEGNANGIDLFANGFNTRFTGGGMNSNGDTFIYMAIRRPDGYVGKPPQLGTDVFNVVAGTSGDPTFKLGFVTDFLTSRPAASSSSWWTYDRRRGTNYLATNTNGAEADGGSSKRLDFMNGFATGASTSDTAWGWKRHAGFDVVCVGGNGSTQTVPHSLNATPEMIWGKNRDYADQWKVYHKDSRYYDGVSYAHAYQSHMELNTSSGASYSAHHWGNTAPTATNFYLGNDSNLNRSGDQSIFYLFSSVEGISKVGSYSGNGSTQTITTGFQPKFLIIKKYNSSGDWFVLDTLRGWGSGNDKKIQLNETSAQADNDMGAPTSTGFSLTSGANWNGNNNNYIYYAHA